MRSRDETPAAEPSVEPTVDPPKPKSLEERVAALEAFVAHARHVIGSPEPQPTLEPVPEAS